MNDNDFWLKFWQIAGINGSIIVAIIVGGLAHDTWHETHQAKHELEVKAALAKKLVDDGHNPLDVACLVTEHLDAHRCLIRALELNNEQKR